MNFVKLETKGLEEPYSKSVSMLWQKIEGFARNCQLFDEIKTVKQLEKKQVQFVKLVERVKKVKNDHNRKALNELIRQEFESYYAIASILGEPSNQPEFIKN